MFSKKKLIILLSMLGFVVFLFINPTTREALNELITTLKDTNMEEVQAYILSFGIWAPIISFFLMIFQAIFAGIPAIAITLGNAAVFGWWQGAFLSWISALSASAICFWLARYFGRDLVVKLTTETMLQSADAYFEKYGKNTILICRLLPFVPFDIVSYAAGLTSMKFRHYIVSTGIGMMPATIIYSYVGGVLTQFAKSLFAIIIIACSVAMVVFVLKAIRRSKKAVS